jgi:hypothetical protein
MEGTQKQHGTRGTEYGVWTQSSTSVPAQGQSLVVHLYASVDSSQSGWEKNRYYIGASELSRVETRPSRAERRRERKKKFQSWKVLKASRYQVTGRKI